jgi:hypothetical protein
MKPITLSALAISAVVATSLATHNAAAGQWIGSGWDYNVSTGGNAHTSCGTGTCYADFYVGPLQSIPANVVVAANVTGTTGGYQTCFFAADLCQNLDIIWGPWLCEADRGGGGHCVGTTCESFTNQTSSAGSADGATHYSTYWAYQGNSNWTNVGTGTGACSYAGLMAGGAYIYQWP